MAGFASCRSGSAKEELKVASNLISQYLFLDVKSYHSGCIVRFFNDIEDTERKYRLPINIIFTIN